MEERRPCRGRSHEETAEAASVGTPEVGIKGGSAGDDLTPEQPAAAPGVPASAVPEPPVSPPQPPTAPPPSAPPPYQPPPPGEPQRRHRPPGATAGIVLIVIGLIFLLGQFVPGIAWWNLWPLIIIIAGIIQAVTPGKEGWSVNRMFDGLVTVVWGLLFLAITSGVIGWDVFGVLLSLWPVLLIAIGFELLGKAMHSSWIRALGSLAVIAALVYAVALSATGSTWSLFPQEGSGEQVTISEPVGSVDEAKLTLEAGATSVTLGSGTDLVYAEGESAYGEPDFSVETAGDTAEVRLSSGDADGTVWWPGQTGSRIDAEFSPDVVWDMDISVGVTDLNADLSELQVRRLNLEPGVANCEVRLGDVPADVDEATAVLQAGVSSIRIEVPRDAEVRIESESGLTGHDISADFDSNEPGVWETPGFDEARADGDGVWIVNVESGIGSIVVDTY